MQPSSTIIILTLLAICTSQIDGQGTQTADNWPTVAATAVASSSGQETSSISLDDKQNAVQQINPNVAGVVGSLLGSIINSIGSGYRPGGGYYSGNGYFPQNGGYYPGVGYYPMNGGYYPTSGSYYPPSSFNSAFGATYPPEGSNYYSAIGNGQGQNGIQVSSVVSQGGFRPAANQGFRPGNSGMYRPYSNQLVYGQIGNRPGVFQVSSAYASSSNFNNGRPYQLVYIKRVPNARYHDAEDLDDSHDFVAV